MLVCSILRRAAGRHSIARRRKRLSRPRSNRSPEFQFHCHDNSWVRVARHAYGRRLLNLMSMPKVPF